MQWDAVIEFPKMKVAAVACIFIALKRIVMHWMNCRQSSSRPAIGRTCMARKTPLSFLPLKLGQPPKDVREDNELGELRQRQPFEALLKRYEN